MAARRHPIPKKNRRARSQPPGPPNNSGNCLRGIQRLPRRVPRAPREQCERDSFFPRPRAASRLVTSELAHCRAGASESLPRAGPDRARLFFAFPRPDKHPMRAATNRSATKPASAPNKTMAAGVSPSARPNNRSYPRGAAGLSANRRASAQRAQRRQGSGFSVIVNA